MSGCTGCSDEFGRHRVVEEPAFTRQLNHAAPPSDQSLRRQAVQCFRQERNQVAVRLFGNQSQVRAVHAAEAQDQTFPGRCFRVQGFRFADRVLTGQRAANPGCRAAVILVADSMDITGRARTESEKIAAAPVNLIVAATAAGPGKTGDFVLFESGSFQTVHGRRVQVPFECVAGLEQLSLFSSRPERSSFFKRQPVCGNVDGPQFDGGLQIAGPFFESLAGDCENQIEADVRDPVSRAFECINRLAGSVSAFQQLQMAVVEGLDAQTQAVDAGAGKTVKFGIRQSVRIRLDTEFGLRAELECGSQQLHQSLHLLFVQLGGCPATDKQRVDRACQPTLVDLVLQCLKERFCQIIAPGNEREIAVPAPVGTEGNVDVDCTRLSHSISPAGDPASVPVRNVRPVEWLRRRSGHGCRQFIDLPSSLASAPLEARLMPSSSRSDPTRRGDRRGARRRSRHSRAIPISTAPRPLDVVSDVEQVPVVTVRTTFPHPNIFRKRVAQVPDTVQAGDLVAVDSTDGSRLGFGWYNPAAEVAVRIICWGQKPPDDAFWDALLERALTHRRQMLSAEHPADALRLLHAEGDFLPGLVADRYANVLSIEAFSLPMFQRAEALAARLRGMIDQVEHVVIRTGPHSESQEGFDAPVIVSPGTPDSVVIQEYGTRFRIRFDEGHKTGFFCDQRENRRRLTELTPGRSVADICCYTGGFAVQAATLGRAGDVTAVDLDETALSLARSNAHLNQARVRCVHADAFSWMRDMVRNGRQFDVLVLDPPKLIHSRSELEEGRRAHFDLNRLAMQLVSPGGILVTFTCAGLLSREEFEKLVCAAARQAGPPMPGAEDRRMPRDAQIFERTGAGPDHPTATNCPESDYLKALWLRLG